MFKTFCSVEAIGLASNRQGLSTRASRQYFAFTLSFLLVFSLLFFHSMATAETGDADFFEQQKISSHLLVNLFLEKLDQSGLVIFKQTISRADLKAHQVSYVHTIADDSLFVRLCFKLKRTILVPNFENYYVDGLTIETDTKGNIIQIKTNISPLQKDDQKQ
jgi:hypothetical protein